MKDKYLLIKHYQNRATDTEKNEVEKWLSESIFNQKEYQQYIKIWLASERAKVLENVVPEKAWRKVKQQTISSVSKWNLTLVYSARIAAAFLLAFGIYWLTNTDTSYEQFAENTTEQPRIVILKDGTEVTLNRGSRIEFPTDFEVDSRKVKLRGNAFFKVTKNPSAPFEVETSKTKVVVLGTSFDITENANQTSVAVATGKVRVENKNASSNTVELIANQRAVYSKGKLAKVKGNSLNHFGWKTGKYIFKNEPLKNVFQLLKKQFEFEVTFSKPFLKNRPLTATFDGESLAEMLRIIELSCQIKIYKKNNNIIISE